MNKKCDNSCKYWSYDMDGVYCTHLKSFELSPVFGVSTNVMSLKGLCLDNFDDESRNTLALWESSNSV